ncbi:MAG: translesion error-prone DNA polymerase V autoproteolytic subunit [Alphaproteobacteria bacterium]|nr:translesion error-prone DNA polymerase V autoproteolytic subunit [Alphaproteobacteria bacterium]
MFSRPEINPSRLELVLFSNGVPAGFPSPAEDHVDRRLDLNDHVVKRPAATFYARAEGESMRNIGIFHGDLLVVDRSITPEPGDVIVATIDGGLAVKRLVNRNNTWFLAPENSEYPAFAVNSDEGIQIWGVVTYSLRCHCNR